MSCSSSLDNREIALPEEKSFQAEGAILKRALRLSLQERNEGIAGLAAAARSG